MRAAALVIPVLVRLGAATEAGESCARFCTVKYTCGELKSSFTCDTLSSVLGCDCAGCCSTSLVTIAPPTNVPEPHLGTSQAA